MQRRMPKVVLALLAGFIAIAVGPCVKAQTPKGLAGTWTLNVAKSKFNPGPPPKSMKVTYTPSADGVKISVDVAWDAGESQHWEMAGKYDGKDYPVTGNPAADMASFKLVNDHTGESTFKKDGKVTATNTRVLSKDGKTLTITSRARPPTASPAATCRSSRRTPRRSSVAPTASGAARRHSHLFAFERCHSEALATPFFRPPSDLRNERGPVRMCFAHIGQAFFRSPVKRTPYGNTSRRRQ